MALSWPSLRCLRWTGKSGNSQSLFGASDTTWDSMEAALSNKIPNAELEQAFRKKGATYADG
jgi:hypothetical protein